MYRVIGAFRPVCRVSDVFRPSCGVSCVFVRGSFHGRELDVSTSGMMLVEVRVRAAADVRDPGDGAGAAGHAEQRVPRERRNVV